MARGQARAQRTVAGQRAAHRRAIATQSSAVPPVSARGCSAHARHGGREGRAKAALGTRADHPDELHKIRTWYETLAWYVWWGGTLVSYNVQASAMQAEAGQCPWQSSDLIYSTRSMTVSLPYLLHKVYDGFVTLFTLNSLNPPTAPAKLNSHENLTVNHCKFF